MSDRPAAAPSARFRIDAQASLASTITKLWPYIWPGARLDLRLRVYVALVLLVVAKLVTIAIPYSFKYATDALTGTHDAAVEMMPSLLSGAIALTSSTAFSAS